MATDALEAPAPEDYNYSAFARSGPRASRDYESVYPTSH